MAAIAFAYDVKRATEVVLWFLNKHGRLDYRKLLKLLFLADCRHLAEYGRPIAGGRYVAMSQGPVQSEIYDGFRALRDGQPVGPDLVFEPPFYLRPERAVREECLSESDLEVLEEIDREYGRMDSQALVDLVHKYKCWKNNEPRPGGPGSITIPYDDIVSEVCNDDMADLICEHQEARAVFEEGRPDL